MLRNRKSKVLKLSAVDDATLDPRLAKLKTSGLMLMEKDANFAEKDQVKSFGAVLEELARVKVSQL